MSSAAQLVQLLLAEAGLASRGFVEWRAQARRAVYRLGYGAGHYDRTLAALVPTPVAVGVAIEDGRLDDLQPQPHDLPMDWIVTEADTFTSRR